jgi:diaminopimelate epimerase
MFNADGSEGRMCGNGIRCVAKYVHERGISRANPMRIETASGILSLSLTVEAGAVREVRVDMGKPRLQATEIPVRPQAIPSATPGSAASTADGRIIRAAFAIPEGPTLAMTCVSMGNPHAVFFVDDVAGVSLETWGPRVERHAAFPERVNVHFVQVRSRRAATMRTWERGSGVTQACGTGACAVCVAGVLEGRTDRTLIATLPGGDLRLEWDETTDHVFMTGPATEVFDGVWVE